MGLKGFSGGGIVMEFLMDMFREFLMGCFDLCDRIFLGGLWHEPSGEFLYAL